MKSYVVKRFLQLIPVVILVSIFSFLIINLAPGDPGAMYITTDMTEEEKQAVYRDLGLDGSIVDQYVGWMKNALQGNFGVSLRTKRPVTEEIQGKLGNTVVLMGFAFVIALIISIPLGLLSGLKKNTKFDHAVGLFTYIGISIPSFWLAIMLIVLFSQKLHWLPSSGMHGNDAKGLLDLLMHMIMPGIVLSLGSIATFTKYMRAHTISELEEEYVQTAKAKGISRGSILYRHVLKNTLLPIITLAGMKLSSLVVGSFIIESIFGWPGLGSLGMTAINSRDYPMIMAFTMFSCVIFITGNFIADILYAAADPRIKQGIQAARGR